MAKEKSQYDKVAYNRKYAKENYTRISVVLNKQTDKDIISHLDTKASKSNYIKNLIREDMGQ